MSPIIPSRYGHPKYNIFPQKSRATSFGGIKGVAQRGTPGSDSKSRRKQRADENKIMIQPKEDEDADNFYSKQLAAARFQRNHRLINVLFNEVIVDKEDYADVDRFQVNRAKRIKSLEEYKSKIDREMVDLNEKFELKKAKMIEDGKKFEELLSNRVAASHNEIETLRAAQRTRQEIKKVLDGIVDSVAESV